MESNVGEKKYTVEEIRDEYANLNESTKTNTSNIIKASIHTGLAALAVTLAACGMEYVGIEAEGYSVLRFFVILYSAAGTRLLVRLIHTISDKIHDMQYKNKLEKIMEDLNISMGEAKESTESGGIKI